jgi:hypothetical protein
MVLWFSALIFRYPTESRYFPRSAPPHGADLDAGLPRISNGKSPLLRSRELNAETEWRRLRQYGCDRFPQFRSGIPCLQSDADLAETCGEDDTSCLILSKYLILENLIWLPISKPDHGPMLYPVELRVAL